MFIVSSGGGLSLPLSVERVSSKPRLNRGLSATHRGDSIGDTVVGKLGGRWAVGGVGSDNVSDVDWSTPS